MNNRRDPHILNGPSSLTVGLILLIIVALGHFICAQGPLTPPGPPSPTMKTLDQIEPRIPVSAETAPGYQSYLYVITQPGSYYLTGDLHGVDGEGGLWISASDVTLDLNGFRVAGVDGSRVGIQVGGSAVCIKNGVIEGWGNEGIDGGGAAHGRAENITIRNCGRTGLEVGDGWHIQSCVAVGNGFGLVNGSYVGVRALSDTVMTRSKSIRNKSGGFSFRSGVLSHCVASDNHGPGFSFILESEVSHCLSKDNLGDGFRHINTISVNYHSCTAQGNQNHGFHAVTAGGRIKAKNCLAERNEDHGFFSLGRLTAADCTANENEDHGFVGGDSCHLTGCSAYSNKNGITVGTGSAVRDCVANENSNSGIVASDTCLVEGNLCHSNGTNGEGIHITGRECTLRHNMVANNQTVGIHVDGDRNLIISNTVRDNGTNFSIVTGNRVGHTIAAPLSGLLSGSASQTAASGVGTTNPWANLEY